MDPRTLVEQAFRNDQGRAVGSLVRAFGDFTLAEEAVQEAYAQALQKWADDPPENPGGWILTTARNRAIDKLRRAGRLEAKTLEMALELDRRQAGADDNPFADTIVDDRLRLMFTCCHPAIGQDAQVALTLRLVAGLTTPQIARAFLVQESTMAARITRAKKKIRVAAIPFRVPPDHLLAERLDAVLSCVYLIFNEGYLRGEGDVLLDAELSGEAIRLGRLLHRLMPNEPEVTGLLALMVLIDSRRHSRARGRRLVRLGEQDRTRWDREMIEEGCALVERALRRGRPGPYQVQAAIQAVHAEARTWNDTDWTQIAGLYASLAVGDPSPVVALNHAVAVGMAEGPEAGLTAIDRIDGLDDYHLVHAARADFLERLGRTDDAREALTRARALTNNVVEQRHLDDRLADL
ncbi:RNA polymerase sigma-70 factor, ECF subfamily [Euzebya pacifica]|uniref:RNA polymerase sigma-70 factor, ECF subfamily n=1 Tax=Euzebya pacifica TaxID=1608957 RepID=A0A346Y2R4_9ACTN|nr:RNA polymerase sigma factor [Euzebya pacifica]AXV08761.1 RNA polymerase sigma-70 factor, ECF subfamily [Euzebya pacifica]